jgi:hypothetical protein
VARLRSRWVMRSHPAVQIARVAVRGQANEKPTLTTSSGGRRSSCAACRSRSFMESGVTPDTIRVHRAACHRYPQFTNIPWSARLETLPPARSCSRLLDFDSTVGWKIANWIRANAKKFGVGEVIYRQHIWTVQRSSEGWRPDFRPGSPSANRMDHMDVSV